MLEIRDLNGNREMLTDYENLKRVSRLNSETYLSFSVIETERNAHCFDLVQEQSVVKFEKTDYRIKDIEVVSIGSKSVKIVQAEHIIFDLLDEYQYAETSGSLTLNDALSFVLGGSGYSYTIKDTFTGTVPFKNLGNDNVLSLLLLVAKHFDAEIDFFASYEGNYSIQFYKQLGTETDIQFRYKHNLKAIRKTISTKNLSTYIKGFGKKNDDGTYVIETDYTSPNAAIYGTLHAPPIFDERYTDINSLQSRLQQEIKDEPEISFTIDASFIDGDLNIGDSIYVIYEPLNIDITARVVEIVDYPEQPKNPEITISNFKETGSDIVANLAKSNAQKNEDSLNDAEETGFCGIGGVGASGITTSIAGVAVPFRKKRKNVPTINDITLTTSSSIATPQITDISEDGFWLYLNGDGTTNYKYWRGYYTVK